MSSVIKVENISKVYRLGEVGTGSLMQDFKGWSEKMFKPQHITTQDLEEHWALKDVSFEVKEGEVLGIIGKNGAGKSTLLKILSKVTAPTSGSVKIKGRIASLLEVGTGFHPDLSGRDNIYLNGAILGMTKTEIKSKFDEIVSFSGVEKFIDTPVKRYSSGMYVRLAFAVAAHLEPEILIIDEVLAVGDAEFQKKCLGKMKDVAVQGRTVLFVSHNMSAIQSLSHAVISLANGTISLPKSPADDAIKHYYQSSINKTINNTFSEQTIRSGTGKLKFTGIEYLNSNGEVQTTLLCGMDLSVRLYYKAIEPINNLSVAIGFNAWSGDNKIILWTELTGQNYDIHALSGFFECHISKFPLSQGSYLINIFAQESLEILDWIQEAVSVEVENGDFYGTGKNITTSHQSVLIEHNWK